MSEQQTRLSSLKELIEKKKESKEFYENQVKLLNQLITYIPNDIAIPFNKFVNLNKDEIIRAINILQRGELDNLNYVKEIILKLSQASQVIQMCDNNFSEMELDTFADLKGYDGLLNSKLKDCISDICKNSKTVTELAEKLKQLKENYLAVKEVIDKLDSISSCNLRFDINLCNIQWINKIKQINVEFLDTLCETIEDIKSVLDYSLDCERFMIKLPCFTFANIVSELRNSFNEANRDLDRALELSKKYKENVDKLKEETNRLKRILKRVGIDAREEVTRLIDYEKFMEYANTNLVNKKAELGIGEVEICILDAVSKSMDLISTVEEVTKKCNVLEEVAIKKIYELCKKNIIRCEVE
ncbi:hypothetical protein [Saccharolobus shibatae]|uniref:Uncharacterized protein n=1 Tax=Saccharolobus shibatae TaxID=2286 RepID=A0A8F5BVP3_9CREN|nr:hypothetical protein [Saccharolobus shibatae]QXJ32184.1 hypothetical protein J5U21_01835 [Saccharolobus shibatae]QXJ35196.1 hypothetical protein J5U22_01743 [Saccharolobus shibatae]